MKNAPWYILRNNSHLLERMGVRNSIMTTVCKDLDENEIESRIRKVRTHRYACQAVAKKALPNERISNCLSRPVGSEVEVWEHLKTEKAFYNGLMVCGSVWNCPVCAAKISERRKKELQKAFETHTNSGGRVALLTLTFSHKRTDKLKKTLECFSKATTKFMTGKSYHLIRQDMGIIGRIKVTEITYGQNGFHPHSHIAIFYENEIDLEKMKLRMYSLWSKACAKFGLSSSSKYGLDLQSSEHAAAYLAKHGNWSLEQEMTKGHIKQGKNGSLTPFDFLREYLETENDIYLKLYAEYAEAFKGKRQVHWSRGLKKHFGIEDKDDEELAKEKVEQADLLGRLTYNQWKQVLRIDRRAQLLDNIEKYGFDIGLSVTLPK